MAMSSSLSVWAAFLLKERPLTAKQRVFHFITTNTVSVSVVLLHLVGHILALPHVSSLSSASPTVCFASGLYGCFSAQACLARAKRVNSWLTTQYVVMGGFLIWSIYVSVLVTGAHFGEVWPNPPGVWGRRFMVLLQLASTTFGPPSYYSMCCIISTLGICIAAMYRALAVSLRDARSKHEVMRLIRHHQIVHKHARDVELFFADALVHLFLCCFTCPFSSTIDVLLGEVTIATFSTAPLLTTVFLPFSFISQDLMDSSTAIGNAAFEAVFISEQRAPKEELFVRRALLLTIASSRRPAQLSCRGLGPLSLGAAGNALRTWYSLVNMVISSGSRTAARSL